VSAGEQSIAHTPEVARGAGEVILVGGGPGEPGLITVAGLAALRRADVVVVDRLAPRILLDELGPEVEVIDVGKTPGRHPVPQHEINRILVQQAIAGRTVVRLKGGDPYVLGRGGEESAACHAAGVHVTAVPGVTSAVAVPGAAGIPLTLRGVASAFTVVSGHDDLAELPGGAEHTVVLLMGVGGLAGHAAALAAGVRGPGCPVAVIEDGFGPRQRVTVGTLGTIAGIAATLGIRSPAVVVVGAVVEHRAAVFEAADPPRASERPADRPSDRPSTHPGRPSDREDTP